MRALLLLSLAMIVAAEDPGETVRVYPVGTSGVALSSPHAWSATRDVDGTALVLRSPLPDAPAGDAAARERARGAVSVALTEVAADETPGHFAAGCRTSIERLGTAVVVEDQAVVSIGGRAWTRLRYRFQVGRFTWRQELHATVIGDHGYCVTCSSEDAAFARWQPAFAAILASLERSRPALESR